METLSYSYLILFQESNLNDLQCKLAFNSLIIKKSTKAVLLSLMMILGLISSEMMVKGIETENTTNNTTERTETSVLKLGSQGKEVQDLQLRLKILKFFTEEQTSTYFGEKTLQAVIAFQKANGLLADGVVGGSTQIKIEAQVRALNAKSESNTNTNTESNTNTSVLKQNSQGEAVKNLQQQLKTLKFFTGATSGYFGDVTKAAVISFQTANGLTGDGVVGSATQEAINKALQGTTPTSENTSSSSDNDNSGNVLKKEMKGEKVTLLQEQLKKINAYNGPVTGYFGSMTEDALKQFQAQNGLTADGILNNNTQGVINQKLQQVVSNSNNNSNDNTPTTNNNVLKLGEKNSQVNLLQEQLTKIGVYNGPITGFFGPQTEEALKKFQSQNGLTADGILGDRTKQLLIAKVTNTNTQGTNINQSSFSSQQIIVFQQQLQALNYYQGKIDGVIGPGTVAALKKFQIENNLSITGIFDSATQTALNKNYLPANHQETIVTPYTLSNNPSVQEIQMIQRRLQVAGLYQGNIDGVMGKKTQEALERARLAYGIASSK